jgi:DNA (cytosine-5)-methyltransferase 1
MTDSAGLRKQKLYRLSSGEPPRVLELCSGCGGMSLGLKAAGFEISAHIESDPSAAASHAANFAPAALESGGAWAQPRDMITCSPETVLKDFGIDDGVSEAFDVLAAGLPCQAFARIGRSKLRSVSGDEDAFRKDPRASLYRRFLEYVQTTQPLAILIENVPDILNFGGHNIPEEICATLEALGYRTQYTLLNAAFYGVPQLRERLFLIALDTSLGISPDFPIPSHCVDLPRGYEGSRCVALTHVPESTPYFYSIPEPSKGLPKALTVRDALGDLPFISEHFTNPSLMRRRRVGDRLPYRINDAISEYALAMRCWPGFETDGEVDGNVVRLTARDFPIFQRMAHGADYPKALKVAEEIFEGKLAALAAQGRRPRRNSLQYTELRSTIMPPYDPSKFPNKWWKLDPSAPSRTLTAHMGKDTYSHIHYDGRQKRTISVREAARLQSFPDGFRLSGAMNAAFRQIGNAVPPLLALAVARTLRQALDEAAMAVSDPQHQFAA